MARNAPKKKPKLTAAERHKRFVEAAREVGASEKLTDFREAFEGVVKGRKSGPKIAR